MVVQSYRETAHPFHQMGQTNRSVLLPYASVRPRWSFVQSSVRMLRVQMETALFSREGRRSGRRDQPDDVGMTLSCAAYKPSLAEDMEGADLIISHAGAGSVMESLRRVIPIMCPRDAPPCSLPHRSASRAWPYASAPPSAQGQ